VLGLLDLPLVTPARLPKDVKEGVLVKYSFACAMDDWKTTVEAQNDEEAVDKIMEFAKVHLGEAHPEMANAPADQLKGMVPAGMKRD
jgi:hypothetical protein